MMANKNLKIFVAQNLKNIGERFCYANENIEYIELNEECKLSYDSFKLNKQHNNIIRNLNKCGVWNDKIKVKRLWKKDKKLIKKLD